MHYFKQGKYSTILREQLKNFKFDKGVNGYEIENIGFLTDIQELKGVALSAKLQCTCGCSNFKFLHTGKQTKGILAPYIVKKKGQLVLNALCYSCGNSIIVYNSEKDGTHASGNSITSEFVSFVSKALPNNLSVVIKYNYFPDKFKIEDCYTNQFENCFIYIVDQNGKEGKALIEE